MSIDIQLVIKMIREFAQERDWDQFHSPKNLVMALNGESGELAEIFQWLSEENSYPENLDVSKLKAAEEEIADIFIYLIRLSDKLNIDLLEAAEKKIQLNEKRYPVDKSKGSAKKYTEL